MIVSCLHILALSAWSNLAWAQAQIRPDRDAQHVLHKQPAAVLGEVIPQARKSSTRNGTHGIPAGLFAELEELARIVDIAYCVGSVGAGIEPPFECPSRCGDFPSFELVTAFNTGPLLSDSCGFIALSHAPAPQRVIVAFRGTYSVANTIADLSTIPQEYVPYPGADDGSPPSSFSAAARASSAPGGGEDELSGGGGDDGHNAGNSVDSQSTIPKHGRTPMQAPAPKCNNCTVHTGFYTSWLNTRELILPLVEEALKQHPTYALTLVGHSLGGAVAAFAGLEFLARGLNPTVTTFGEPRIGNAGMAEYLDKRFGLARHGGPNPTAQQESPAYRRVTHVGDPVPLLPLNEWGYVPHSGEIFIEKWDVPPEVEDVRFCEGAMDPTCVAEPENGFWAIPARFKLWQLFFAHRDYFWRLGICMPSFDGWWPASGQNVVESVDL